MSKVSNKVNLFALAVLGVFGIAPLTHAQQTYDFSSSTAEVQALGGSLVSAGFTIAFYAIGAFIVLGLALMGAGYVWAKFKKFSGIGRKI